MGGVSDELALMTNERIDPPGAVAQRGACRVGFWDSPLGQVDRVIAVADGASGAGEIFEGGGDPPCRSASQEYGDRDDNDRQGR